VYDIRILDVRARVIGPPALLRELRELFPRLPPWETTRAREIVTTLRVECDASQPTTYRIVCDGTPAWTAIDPDQLLPTLEWAINARAVERLRDRYLLFHAGSVAHAGEGFIFPAASGSGKTTLVAGLVAAGCQHLSDEVAVLDPSSLRLAPFPRSMCVKHEARQILDPLWPKLADSAPHNRFGVQVYYLRPDDEAWSSGPVSARYVVFPRYVPHARTSLVPISRSSALVDLLAQSFSGSVLGRRTIDVSVALLREADCYALTIGNLGQAVDLLLRRRPS
jgi:HprK-related kinase A